MKGEKSNVVADALEIVGRRPRRDRARIIQHVIAAVAARSLKETIAMIAEDFPEVADFKRKTELVNYLCQHEDVAKVLEAKLK